MNTYYIATFKTSLGADFNLRIGNANPDITAAEAFDALEEIKDANAFLPKYGELISADKLMLYSVTATELAVV